MAAARKAESKMEDAKEKVRAWSSAATEVKGGSKELDDQIASLMSTALNRAEQSTHLQPLQTVPGTGVMGEGRWTGVSSFHNGQTGLGQNTSAHSSSVASRVTTASQSRRRTQALTGAQSNAKFVKDSSAVQCFRCQGWGHMARECATLAKLLNKDGGNQGNVVKPPQHTVKKLTTFPP